MAGRSIEQPSSGPVLNGWRDVHQPVIVAAIQGQAQGNVRGRVLVMYTIISQVVLASGALVYALGAAHTIVPAGAVIAVLALVNALWMGALRSYQGVAAAQSGNESVS